MATNAVERFARQLRQHPAFMAHALQQVMTAEQIDETTLARQLGLTPRRLTRLALCLRPRPDHFDDDVQAIADYTGADPDALRRVLGY